MWIETTKGVKTEKTRNNAVILITLPDSPLFLRARVRSTRHLQVKRRRAPTTPRVAAAAATARRLLPRRPRRSSTGADRSSRGTNSRAAEREATGMQMPEVETLPAPTTSSRLWSEFPGWGTSALPTRTRWAAACLHWRYPGPEEEEGASRGRSQATA